MNAVSDFKKFQQDQSRSLEWANLLGKKYTGGTRTAAYGDLRTVSCELVIYHQEYDGAKNYHDAPDLIKAAIENQIRARFKDILADALNELDTKRGLLAIKAHEEHLALMVEAGLAVGP